MILILVWLAGLIFGSFYNVVIYRVPLKKSIVSPRSACSSCGTVLAPEDLFPVFSFLFLRGKCRYCKAPISIQYPIVELLTAILFTVLYVKYGLSVEWFFSAFLMSILLIVFFIDLKHMIIPNGLVLTGLAGGVAFFILRLVYTDSILGTAPWYSPLLGMVAASGFLLLVALIGMAIYGGDALGMGDVKIFIPIGLFLGLKLSLISLVFSIFIGGFAGLFLMITGLKSRKSQIPFGPFIVIGTFLAMLFGENILVWYLGVL